MDQLRDTNGAELVAFASKIEFPDFVKKADLEVVSSSRQCSVYADSAKKQFPCDSPASTWLSCVFFEEKKASVAEPERQQIQANLNKWAEYWEISSYVEAARKALHAPKQTVKKAESLDDTAYAYVSIDPKTGQKERRLPINTTQQVKAAADWIVKYRDELPFHVCNHIAINILEKAASLGVGLKDLTDKIEKLAGRGLCTQKQASTMVWLRIPLIRDPKLLDQFKKIAHAVENDPTVINPDTLVKLAQTIDTLDTTLNIKHRYGQDVTRPEDVLFSTTYEKLAQDADNTFEILTGSVFEKEPFKQIKIAKLRNVFGDEFIERITNRFGHVDTEKVAEEAATLPLPDAQVFEEIAKESGIQPIGTKAASHSDIPQPELDAYAEAYLAQLRH